MTQYTVGDFQGREDILLITDSQDIQAVADDCNFDGSKYGFLMVVTDGDCGEFTEVYASEYSVPAYNYPLKNYFKPYGRQDLLRRAN